MNQNKIHNRESSRKLLIEAGINHWKSFNNDVHWKIGEVDFFPTTLKWIDNENDEKGLGCLSLIDYLENKYPPKIFKPGQAIPLTEEQFFDLAKRCKQPMSLESLCKFLHKEIYKNTN